MFLSYKAQSMHVVHYLHELLVAIFCILLGEYYYSLSWSVNINPWRSVSWYWQKSISPSILCPSILYSSWFKLYSSILYGSRLKAIFERTKVFKFYWIIYNEVFSRILLNSVAMIFYPKTFLIVNAVLPFCVNILRHRSLSGI